MTSRAPDGAWLHQLRVHLGAAEAEAARSGRPAPALEPLRAVLARHGARMVSQLDAFEGYVAEAERQGPEGFPLYKWTKATLADPEKRARHARVFALRLGEAETYPAEAADALEADLRSLAGGAVERVSRHDTNPAGNIPVPAEHR